MKNKVLENSILSSLEIKKEDITSLLTPVKRGRKSFEEMNDNEIYDFYVRSCQATKVDKDGKKIVYFTKPVVSKDTYLNLISKYDFLELMSTEEIDINDSRRNKESYSDKINTISGDSVDFDAIEELTIVLGKALKNRLIIILNLEDLPSLISQAYACHFNYNNCKNINELMKNRLNQIEVLRLNDEVQKWLSEGVNDLALCIDNNGIRDYIDTYSKVLRQLSNITNEPLNELKDLIHRNDDKFENEILKNKRYVEVSYYSENEGDSDDLDDIVNNEIANG